MLVVLGFLLDLFVCWKWAGPLLPFLAGGAVAWCLAAGRSGLVAGTASGLAAPVLLGLTVVCVALVALNLLPGYADPRRVHGAELLLSHARITINQWTHLGVEAWLIVGSALVALAVLATSLEPVKRFTRAHDAFGFAQTLLFVLTSFVIYAQPPLQRELNRTHARIASEYRAALDREWNAHAVRAAAITVKRTLQSPTAQRRLAGIVAKIDRAAKGNSDAVRALEDQALPPAPAPVDVASLEQERVIDPVPSTGRQLDQQVKAVADRQSSAGQAESAAAQAVTAVFHIAAQIAGLPIAGVNLEGVHSAFLLEGARTALEDAISNLADRLRSAVVNGFLSKEKEALRHGEPLDSVTLADQELPSENPKTFAATFLTISPTAIEHAAASATSPAAAAATRGFQRQGGTITELVDAEFERDTAARAP